MKLCSDHKKQPDLVQLDGRSCVACQRDDMVKLLRKSDDLAGNLSQKLQSANLRAEDPEKAARDMAEMQDLHERQSRSQVDHIYSLTRKIKFLEVVIEHLINFSE